MVQLAGLLLHRRPSPIGATGDYNSEEIIEVPMQRSGLITTFLAALLAMAVPAAAATSYQEGEHYERLPIPVDTREPSKVEVVEVFSYGCIHCKTFQPSVDAWREEIPEHVDFYRMPATFNQSWEALAQLFYAVEALGITDRVHWPIFEAIHEGGENLTDPDLMAGLIEREAGIEPERFHQVFKSFSVRSRVQQAHARGLAYRLSGTPTMIVDGRYRVDGRMAGGNAEMLNVVDYLVAQRHAGESEEADPASTRSGPEGGSVGTR
jgi:thiol:disulfide interchange protein DsbA